MATAPRSRTTFKPFVPATETRPELSVRALLLGAIFGILFGAVTVYVGLRAGLTVAASIPISVLSISILRAFGKSSILENNIVQTTGNAGQSIASGVIFTLPALIFLGFDLESTRIFALALFGGWLGVLFMIPLRKQLIVDEHDTLLYPEGTACADVLQAGERGGSFASRVFLGLGFGAVYTLFQNENLFALWPSTPNYQPDLGAQHLLRGSAIRADVTPEYLGVGYIIGIRTAAVMLAGGAFSWLVLMPAISFFGGHLPGPLYPGTVPIHDMGPSQLWSTYVRPMGAGAVAAAGLITLCRTLPTIASALAEGLRNIRNNKSSDQPREAGAPSMTASPSWVGSSGEPTGPSREASARAASTEAGDPSITASPSWVGSSGEPSGQPRRTEHDLPPIVVLGGSVLLIALLWIFLQFHPVPGAQVGPLANLAASLLVVLFGFLFVTVSARIVGIVGSSASPVSGMTIATLMATAAIFLVKGWTAPAFGALAITIGGIVCIAASNAGDTAQDLKTGYLIGATPWKQQLAIMIGVIISTVSIGATLNAMNTGLETFDRLPHPIAVDLAHLPDGVQNTGHFKRDHITISGPTIPLTAPTAATTPTPIPNTPVTTPPEAEAPPAHTTGRIQTNAAASAPQPGNTTTAQTRTLVAPSKAGKAAATPSGIGKAAVAPSNTDTAAANPPLLSSRSAAEGSASLPQTPAPATNPTVHQTKAGSIGTPTSGKEELPAASSYILLNAIGSTTLEDGKYLYNPATGTIDVQWIQGIGSEKAAAPQGRLMATVINGILSRKLPWSLVLLGVFLVIAVELLGIRSLTFAVGAYLSIATTLAIFVGGLMRWMVDRAMKQHAARQADADHAAFLDRWRTAHTAWLASRPNTTATPAPDPAGSAADHATSASLLSSRSAAKGSAPLPVPPTHQYTAFLQAHPELIPFPGFDPANPEHLNPVTQLPSAIAMRDPTVESEISPGSLYASGLIAAGGIVGLLGVCVKLYEAATDRSIPRFTPTNPLHHDWISVLAFAALAFSLYYFARKPLDITSTAP